ncbi:MAG: hypothetical protein F6K65_32160 [Moorea sp. SIO3C2]|nr:hypothetical protein [Moorena sp. SIO3C2]
MGSPTDVSGFPAKMQVKIRDLDAPEPDETMELAGATPLTTVNEDDKYIEKINLFSRLMIDAKDGKNKKWNMMLRLSVGDLRVVLRLWPSASKEFPKSWL